MIAPENRRFLTQLIYVEYILIMTGILILSFNRPSGF